MSRFAWVYIGLALAGCLRPGEDWTAHDARVGQAELDGISLVIDEGAAAIHHLERQGATLWAGAPVWTGRLTNAAGLPFTLRLRNVLADSALTVDGQPAELVEQPVPTEQVWRFTPVGERAALALAPPDAEDPGPWRFAVMSDVQGGFDRVDDVWAAIAAHPGVRLVISAGDLVDDGTDAELIAFQTSLRALPVPLYATPGNHERGVPAGPWHRWFGRGSHSFVYRGVRCSFVDSSAATVDPPIYALLEGWLDAARDGAHVVASHVPPFDPSGSRSGAFRSRREAAKFVALLGRGGVDAAFHGHVHGYYAYSAATVPTYISGGGGAIEERLDGLSRHFLAVDVDAAAVRQVGLVRVD